MGLVNWSPLTIAFVMLVVDFAAINILRVIIEHKHYLGKWWSFKLGDTIFLPAYAYFSTSLLQENHITVSDNLGWYILMLLMGFLLVFFIESQLVKRGIYSFKRELRPSQLYHTIIFGPIFALLVGALPFVLIYHSLSSWAATGTILSGIGFLGTYALDLKSFDKKGRE